MQSIATMKFIQWLIGTSLLLWLALAHPKSVQAFTSGPEYSGLRASPVISSVSISDDNSYIDVLFNEGIYNTNAGSGALEVSDFTLFITGGTAVGPLITSIKKNDNADESLATALTGGESTIRIFFSTTGLADGAETLTVNPINGTSIFSLSGDAASDIQINNTTVLKDKVAPVRPNRSKLDASTNSGVSDSDAFTTHTIWKITGSAEPLTSIQVDGTYGSLGTTMADASGDWFITTEPQEERHYSVSFTATDSVGNISERSFPITVQVDLTAPKSSIYRHPLSTEFISASSVVFHVNFDEAEHGVDLSDFSISGPAANGVSLSYSELNFFGFIIHELTVNNITTEGVLALDFTSSTDITDPAGNAFVGVLTAKDTYTIDNTAPTVTNITATSPNGAYGSKDEITLQISFSEAVNVIGSPTLELETGAIDQKAIYNGTGNGTSTLEFTYTVQSGDDNADLDYTGINALELNGGTINDEANLAANLSLPVPGTSGSLGVNVNLAVDGSTPTFTATNLSNDNKYVDVTFTEGVYNTNSGSGVLEASDFALVISGGSAMTPIITSVKKNDNTVESVASSLTGGEVTVRVFFNTTGIPDGAETLTIDPADDGSIFDASGNAATTGQINNTTTMNDQAGPVISAVSIPNESHKVGDAIPVTIQSAEAGLSFVSGTVNGIAVSDFRDNADNSYSVTYTVVEGHTDRSAVEDIPVSLVLSDANGNHSAPYSTPISQTADLIDANSPSNSIVTPIATDDMVNAAEDEAVLVSGTTTDVEDGRLVVVLFDDGANPTVQVQANVSNNTWTATSGDISGLENGNITVTANVSDFAGNPAPESKIIVVLDNVPPAWPPVPSLDASTDLGHSDSDGFTNSTVLKINGTAEASSTVTVTATDGVLGTTMADAAGIWTLTTGTLSAMHRNISITATDAAGNEGDNSFPLTVTIDLTPPTVSLIDRQSPIAEHISASTAQFRVYFNAQDVYNVDINDFELSGTAAGGTAAISLVNNVFGNTTYDVTVTGIDMDGELNLGFASSQDIIDRSGNAFNGAISTELTYSIDQTPPDTPSIPDLHRDSDSGVSNSDNITSATTPTFTGNVEAGSIVTIVSSVDGILGTTVADDSGDWSFTTNTLSEARHDITVTAKDALQNESLSSSSLSLIIDTTAPSGYTAIIDQSSINSENLSAISYTFSGAEVGSTYQYVLSSSNSNFPVFADGTVLSANDQILIGDVSSLYDGTITLHTNLVDLAGNDGDIINDYTIKDEKAPVVTIVSSTANDGTYGAGELITIEVSFDEVVIVSGIPSLSLETGGVDQKATYNGIGSGTTTLQFDYIVQTGDVSGDLDYESIDALTAGTSIKDVVGNSAILTLPTPGNAGSLSDNSALIIDTESAVSLSVDNTSIDENGGSATLTASLSTVSATDIIVLVSYLGTSTNGIDYNNSASTTITIQAGQSSANASVIISAIDDNEAEGDETIIVEITSVTGGKENEEQSVTITLQDNDIPSVSFASTSSSNPESVSSADLLVNTSIVSALTVMVDYTITGTAIGNGTDYTLANGTLVFDPGSTAKNITIASIIDDAIVEANETVIVTLSNPSNALLGTNTVHTYTIDNDDAASVTIEDVGGAEDGGVITLTATLDNAVDSGFMVDVSTIDGTASTNDPDYLTITGHTLTFEGKAGETQVFTLTPTADAILELDENLMVNQSNLSGTPLDVDISDNATVTIQNDDAAELSIGDVVQSEGNDGTTAYTFSVLLSGAIDQAVNVDYTTSDGTGTLAGNDYKVAIGTLSFSGKDGEVQEIVVDVLGDITEEDNETFVVLLSNISDGGKGLVFKEGENTATGTIINEDDNTAPSEFTVTWDDVEINADKVTSASFTFDGAETSSLYKYSISSTGGSTPVTGNGVISSETDQISISGLSALADGSLTLSVTLTDAFSNESVPRTDEASLDTKAPTVIISSEATSPVNTAFIAIFTFNEIINDFDLADITVGNGSASAFTHLGGTIYTAVITPAAEGEVMIDVAANVAQDAVGNDNTAAARFSIDYEFPNNIPTRISISGNSITENNAIGDFIGSFSTTDEDTEDTFTYSLVSGSGDTDNATFTIDRNKLLAGQIFDFELQENFSIRVQTNDGNGGTLENNFNITVTNIEEPVLRLTSELNIPLTALGLTTAFEITVHNDGEGTLEVTDISYPEGFSGPANTNVAAGSDERLTMFFSPLEEKVYQGDVIISSNVGDARVGVRAEGAIVTGVDDDVIVSSEVSLYPNPATDVLTIGLKPMGGHPLNIDLINTSGIKVFSRKRYKESVLEIKLSDYQHGIYLVRISNEVSSVTKKIIIKR